MPPLWTVPHADAVHRGGDRCGLSVSADSVVFPNDINTAVDDGFDDNVAAQEATGAPPVEDAKVRIKQNKFCDQSGYGAERNWNNNCLGD